MTTLLSFHAGDGRGWHYYVFAWSICLSIMFFRTQYLKSTLRELLQIQIKCPLGLKGELRFGWSKVNFFVASQFSAKKILTIIQRHSSGTVTWLVQPWGGKSIYSIDLWYTLELPFHCSVSLQVLRYFDYVFTGVFTFEMIIKVSHCLKIIG